MQNNIFAAIVQNNIFQRIIISVIVATAILVGLETYEGLYAQYNREDFLEA